ncbi:unnamed protein product, partial [Rotaria sp. Silwood1]
RARRLTAMV